MTCTGAPRHIFHERAGQGYVAGEPRPRSRYTAALVLGQHGSLLLMSTRAFYSTRVSALAARGRVLCVRSLRLTLLLAVAGLFAAATLGGCLEQPLEAIGRGAGGGSGHTGESSSHAGGSSGSLGGGEPGGTGEPTCVAYGASCSETSPCCRGTCEHGSCRDSAAMCLRQGEACSSSSSCCMGDCGADGFCARLDCLRADTVCKTEEECCSHQCTAGKCAPLNGCHPLGELCRIDMDCCSYSCKYDQWSNRLRCMAAAPCLGSGELCGEMLPECCGEQAGLPSQICALDTKSGVNRCMPRSDHCAVDGTPCAHAAECCGAYCLPNEGGWRACSTFCAELGERCEQKADCCEDGECRDGACVAPAWLCVEQGMPCEEDSQCCDGNCEPATELCGQPPGK